MQTRIDIKDFILPVPNTKLIGYWRDDSYGKGPCLSLYIKEEEVLRCDCFETDGHYHFRGIRNLWSDNNYEEQLAKAFVELKRNFGIRNNNIKEYLIQLINKYGNSQ